MILHRFVKSWKGVTILVLVCVVVFMGLIIDTQVRTQMLTIQENDQLKVKDVQVQSWKDCLAKIDIWENNGKQFISVEDVNGCRK